MADNTQLNAGAGGNTFRTFEDGSSIHWPAGVTCFLTSLGTPDVAVPVLPTQGLPVRLSDASGYLATLPVSAASLPLPTGAATAALQGDGNTLLSAIGTLLSGTLTVSVSALPGGLATGAKQDTGNASLASIDGKLPALAGGSVPVTGPLTDAQLRASAVPVDGSGVTQPVSAASLPLPTGAATEATLSALNGKVTACNTGAVTISAALPAGTNNIGDVDVVTLPALPAGSNTIGNVGTLPVTSGGLTPYSFLSTAAVQAAELKGSAGQVYSVQFFNSNASPRYVRLYDQAGAPAAGDTANIKWRGMIPGNTAVGGFVFNFPQGLAFGTGIGIRVTAAVADNDNTALGANEVIGNVQFK